MLRPNESISEDGSTRTLSIPRGESEQHVYEEAQRRGTLFQAYGSIWQVYRVTPGAAAPVVTFVRIS